MTNSNCTMVHWERWRRSPTIRSRTNTPSARTRTGRTGPRSMHDMTSDGNAVANSVVADVSNENFKCADGGRERRDGALGTVEKVSDDPLEVKYTFSSDANWSDGTPVDAADLALTLAARSQ